MNTLDFKQRKAKSFSLKQTSSKEFIIKRVPEIRKRQPQQNMYLKNYQNSSKVSLNNKQYENDFVNQRIYFNNLLEMIPKYDDIKKDNIQQLIQNCKQLKTKKYIHKIQELPQIQNQYKLPYSNNIRFDIHIQTKSDKVSKTQYNEDKKQKFIQFNLKEVDKWDQNNLQSDLDINNYVHGTI